MKAYNTHKSATEIAALLIAAGYTYRGHKPSSWEGRGVGRIYFGRAFLTVRWGEVTACKNGPFSALGIGEEAVDAAARVLEEAKNNESEDSGCCSNYEREFISFADLGGDDFDYIAGR